MKITARLALTLAAAITFVLYLSSYLHVQSNGLRLSLMALGLTGASLWIIYWRVASPALSGLHGGGRAGDRAHQCALPDQAMAPDRAAQAHPQPRPNRAVLQGSGRLHGHVAARQIASTLDLALAMDEREQRRRMSNMRRSLREHNIYQWAGRLIEDLAKIPSYETPVGLDGKRT